jgi:hypothetical protein
VSDMRFNFAPSVKIDSVEAVVAHYVEWSGFNLDWAYRSKTNKPVIMSISRDNLSLFLIKACLGG